MPAARDPRTPAFPGTPGWGQAPPPPGPWPAARRTAADAVTLSWPAAGPAGGPATYHVQQSLDAGATWANVETSTTATSLAVPAEPGQTLAFRVLTRRGGRPATGWGQTAAVEVDAGEGALDWPAGVSAAGGATALDPLTKRGYVAAAGPGGLELREFNYGTMALLRTLDLSGTPLTRLDVLLLDPGSGGWLYGLEVGNHYLIAVDLRLWDKTSGVDPYGAAWLASGLGAADVVKVYDLTSLAGVVSLSGGITASPVDEAVYVSAYGVGGPDVVELKKGWTGAGAGDLTVNRVLTLSGVGGARAGGLALDPVARKLYAATTSTGTTGRVAAVNIDSLLQTGQATFATADGAGNYRTNGAVVDGQAYFASDSEASSLVKVGADLVATALDLPGFGWVRGLFATGTDLYLGGQNTDAGTAELRSLSLADLAEVARIVVGDPLRPLLDAVAASSASITISWADPFAGHGRGWVVRRSVSSSEGPWENIATVSSDTTTYTDTGLDPNKTYWYQVRAVRVLNAEDLVPLIDPFANVVNALTGLAASLYGFAQAYSEQQQKTALQKKALSAASNPPAAGGGLQFWGSRDPELAEAFDKVHRADELNRGMVDGTGVTVGLDPLPLLQALARSITDKADQVADWWGRTRNGETAAAEASRKAYWAAYNKSLVDNGVLPDVLHWRLQIGGVDLSDPTGRLSAERKADDAYSAEIVAADPHAAERGRHAAEVDGVLFHVGMAVAPLGEAPRIPTHMDPGSSPPRLMFSGASQYEGENVAIFQLGNPRRGIPHRVYSVSEAEFAETYTPEVYGFRAADGRLRHFNVIDKFGLNEVKDELNGFSWYLRQTGDRQLITIVNGSGYLERGIHPQDMPELAAELRRFAGAAADTPVVITGAAPKLTTQWIDGAGKLRQGEIPLGASRY